MGESQHPAFTRVPGGVKRPLSMGFAVLTILVAVLAGTLLAFLPRQKAAWMGPMRTFGLAAAISVVALDMVPESVEAIGAWAVVALAVGLVLPALLGRLGSLLWRAGHPNAEPRHMALEAGYAGLLVHKVGDGIALGVYAGELHPAGSGHGFATALAAHIVPVVAIVVLTFDSVRGRGSALLRAVGLAVAGVLGVLLTHSVPLEEMSAAHGWLAAAAAGMLLHVVMHDLGADLPQTRPARLLDLAMAALGLSVSALGGAAHGHGSAHASEALLLSLHGLVIETGPALVVALALGVLLTATLPRLPSGGHGLLGPAADVLRASLLGVERGSPPVLPISAASYAGGVPPRFLLALLLATPALAIETLAASAMLLGWELSLLRLLGSFLVAVAAAALLSVVLPPRPAEGSAPRCAPAEIEGSISASLLTTFDHRVLRTGGWMLVFLVLAALVDVSLAPAPGGAFAPGQVALIALLAIPSYLCPPAALPLALVLFDKGLTPGDALLGLLIGGAGSLQGLGFLRRWFGLQATVFGLLETVLGAFAIAVLTHLWLGSEAPLGAARVISAPGIAWQSAAAAAGLVLARAVYRASLRGFLLPLEGRTGHAGAGVALPGSELSGAHHGHGHGTAPVPPGPAHTSSTYKV